MRWKEVPLPIKIIAYVILFLLTSMTLAPFMYFVSLSVSEFRDTYQIFLLPRSFTVDNYVKAWNEVDLGRHLFNSLYITGSALALNLSVGALAAYALARFRFPLREPIYNLFIAGLILSAEVLLIPLFLNTRQLGMTNQPYTLPIVYATIGLPLTIFILRAFFESLPGEIMDAALTDGANIWQTFWYVALPMSRSGLLTVGLFQFVFFWDEFALSYTLVTNPALRPLSSGLAKLYGEYFIDYPVLAASLVFAVIPVLIVYLLTQKQLLRGMTMGALK
ncbi:MAG: carbohydrate ABC transporter permease [Chloroflexi bacterium]|nr:carbohydrate ABC transporter permease [Chloroflexota bacterium]